MSAQDYIYCYQGKALRVGSGNVVVGKLFDPYDPSTIEPCTIRCRFFPGYTPTMGNKQTIVVESENIWDITKSIAPQDHYWDGLFSYNTNLLEVLGANTTGVTSISKIFEGCSNLESVQLFDTSNIRWFDKVFAGTKITSVPLFDTRLCLTMYGMFSGCTALTTVPLFDTSSCTKMNQMFLNCSSLTSVPLFDTSSCTDMDTMFRGCTSLTTVPIFNTSSCTDMTSMFIDCSSLITIPLFDTSLVESLYNTFWGCTNVESGALALYQQASSQTNVPQHNWTTFYNCGINTESGRAEMAQIPKSWGGTMA